MFLENLPFNFADLGCAKSAILTHFGIYAFLHFLKAEFYQINQNSESKNGSLECIEYAKLISHKI